MIRNTKKYQQFQQDQIAQEKFTYDQALRIYESLLSEARNLGVINSANIMDGIEVNIKIARAINSLN